MYLYGIASKMVPESVDVELLSDVVDAVAVLEGQVELVVGVQHIETVPIRSKHLTFKLLKKEMPKNPYFSNNAQFIMLNDVFFFFFLDLNFVIHGTFMFSTGSVNVDIYILPESII